MTPQGSWSGGSARTKRTSTPAGEVARIQDAASGPELDDEQTVSVERPVALARVDDRAEVLDRLGASHGLDPTHTAADGQGCWGEADVHAEPWPACDDPPRTAPVGAEEGAHC